MEPQILFYENPYYMLSNWSAHQVLYNDILYITAEHAYHAHKFIDHNIQQQIQRATSPYKAKEIADIYKDQIRNDWDEIKVHIMEEILRAKVDQHTDVHDTLLQSNNTEIIENSPYDTFWGIGKDHTGENMLGKIWMNIRKELQAVL